MKNIKNTNGFLVVSVSCIVILLMMCYFSVNNLMKGTYGSFGGITGTITVSYKITYSSNWPVIDKENIFYEDEGKKDYVLLDNMFDVPKGYEFVSWNTKSDGTGDTYLGNMNMTLSDNIELYAQWNVVLVEEVIAYGDINLNGEIDNDDYLLLEKYTLGSEVLNEQALLNGDVNNDGNVDEVDVDIIKQVYLGTDGYTGFLPNSPVLIYEIYKESMEEGTASGGGSDGNDTSSETGNGSGSLNGTGSGTGNSGNASNNNYGNTNGNVQGNTSVNEENESDSVVDDSEEIIDDNNNELTYKFKFMNGKMEYASTICNVLEDGTCNLLLPKNNPTKEGYMFTGWSSIEGCPNDNGIVNSIIVNDSGTYYACFIKNDNTNEDSNSGVNVWIIVISLWIIVISVISHLIIHFRKKNVDKN